MKLDQENFAGARTRPGMGSAEAAEARPAGDGTTPETPSMLELENSGLRRLVVELLEKNQQLREALSSSGNH